MAESLIVRRSREIARQRAGRMPIFKLEFRPVFVAVRPHSEREAWDQAAAMGRCGIGQLWQPDIAVGPRARGGRLPASTLDVLLTVGLVPVDRRRL